VDHAAGDEDPSGDDVDCRDIVRRNEQHDGRVEDDGQLELVGEIVRDACDVMRLIVAREVVEFDLASLHGALPRDRQPDVKQECPADLREQGPEQ
jgi:hypothetical protein